MSIKIWFKFLFPASDLTIIDEGSGNTYYKGGKVGIDPTADFQNPDKPATAATIDNGGLTARLIINGTFVDSSDSKNIKIIPMDGYKDVTEGVVILPSDQSLEVIIKNFGNLTPW